MPIIEIDHVTKEFRLGRQRSLRQSLADLAARVRGKSPVARTPFKALDDVSFTVEPGEVLGIIGHNGAGKSTLLKILAGITKPTHGRVAVRGKVAPLIEVGAGLVPDLTGRENIYINGAILGMRRTEIARKFDEIVAFAELEEFIDTPVKRYSSGMMVRLGFSIATSVEAEILIVDEVLAVGDLAFQRKCFDRMERLIRQRGNTVLLVSHNLRQVERLSSRVLLLGRGTVLTDSDPTSACNRFYQLSDRKIAAQSNDATRSGRFETSGEIELLDCCIVDDHGKPTAQVEYGTDATIRVRYRVHRPLKKPLFGVGIHTTDFLYLSTSQSLGRLNVPEVRPGDYELVCRFRKLPLLPGIYSLRLGVALGDVAGPVFYGENIAHFHVVSSRLNRAWVSPVNEGFFAIDTSWSLTGEGGVSLGDWKERLGSKQ